MDCMVVDNPSNTSLEFNLFEDSQFKDEGGKTLEHCECCFYPIDDTKWLGFLEIKDCKPKHIATYREKAKQQLISTVAIFKKEGLCPNHQLVYGIISYPRRNKTSFNEYIFGDVIEQTRLKRKYGINFMATNNIKVDKDRILSK